MGLRYCGDGFVTGAAAVHAAAHVTARTKATLGAVIKGSGRRPLQSRAVANAPGRDLRFFLRTATPAVVLGGLAAIGCYLAAGRSLGFYLGPVIAAALLVPPLV